MALKKPYNNNNICVVDTVKSVLHCIVNFLGVFIIKFSITDEVVNRENTRLRNIKFLKTRLNQELVLLHFVCVF